MKIKFYASFLSLFFFSFCNSNIVFGQHLMPHKDINDLPSLSNPTSFQDMIGTTAGKDIQRYINQNSVQNIFPVKGVVRNIRSFHDMASDFANSFAPKDSVNLIVNDCACDLVEGGSEPEFAPNCYTGCGEVDPNGNPKWFGFADWKAHYCAWKNFYGIDTIYASLETINKFFNNGFTCSSGNSEFIAQFPNKWYTYEEWGGTLSSVTPIRNNAKKYIENFVRTFCPDDDTKPCLVNVLEIGNEPWGVGSGENNNEDITDDTPGIAGYHAILAGAVDAMIAVYGSNKSDWRMKLSTAALEAYNDNPGCFGDVNQYVEDMFPASYAEYSNFRQYFDYLNIHNYAFTTSTVCDGLIDETPESPTGNFLTLKNMRKWMENPANNIDHAQLNITEFGWNSSNGDFVVGEANQSIYTMRAWLLAARYGVNKAFNYGTHNPIGEPQFNSTGILKDENSDGSYEKKLLAQSLETMINKGIYDKHFLSVVQEPNGNNANNGVFAYLIGDYPNTPTYLVAWRASNLGTSNNENYPNLGTVDGFPIEKITLSSGLEVNTMNNKYFYLGWNESFDRFVGDNIVNQNGVGSNEVNIDLSGLPIVIPVTSSGSGSGTQTTDCNGEAIEYGNGTITLTNTTGVSPYFQIQDASYIVVDECGWNCGGSFTVSNLSDGDYIVNFRNSNWQTICSKTITLSSSGGSCSGQGGDGDGDGVCYNDDCDDNDPNLTTIGAPCNDGNPNTENDIVQSGQNGCFCQGTPSSGNGDCSGLTFSGGSGQITVTGFNAGLAGTIEYIGANTGWSNVTYCNGNCTNPAVITGVAAGTYTVKVYMQLSGGGYCYREESVTVTLGSGCTDGDGDGVCQSDDCDDNDATIGAKQPQGTPCNDGDPNTINDVIQADGCTCAGTNSGNTTTCQGVTITYGNGSIDLVGQTGTNYSFKVQYQNDPYTILIDCYQCSSSESFNNLPDGPYAITINYNSCGTINLSGGSLRIAPNNTFDLSANAIQQTVQLEWIASQTDETESFTIEKSIDGIHFKPIKVVVENLEDYYFKNQDESPDFGTNYYRIKQQFASGEIRYSPIRKETFYLDENTISLYPNPAKEELWVNLGELSNVGGNISIYNMLGQEITQKVLKDGEKQLRFNVADYQNGLYYLTIKTKGNRAITKRFVVEHWR